MINSISFSNVATLVWCFSLLLLSTRTHSNKTDHLLAIKSQLQGPLGPTSSWKDSLNLCQWTGVTCSHRHPRVTKLDLRSKSIGGFLSPFVGNPSFVRVIVLATNSFYGEIPNEVGCLSRLETLVLNLILF